MKQEIKIEVDIPDGWEFDRYGVPNVGENYLGMCYGDIHLRQPSDSLVSKYFVIRKIKQWRDPVLPADFGKEARFSDNGKKWNTGELAGWFKEDADDDMVWVSKSIHGYRFCQVCDEEAK